MGEMRLGTGEIGKMYLGDKQILGMANILIVGDYGNPIIVVNDSNVVKRFNFENQDYNNITLQPMQMALLRSHGNDDNLYALNECKCEIYQGTKYSNEDGSDSLDLNVNYNKQCKQGDVVIGLSSVAVDDFGIVIIKE